jgi:hypothetical protein
MLFNDSFLIYIASNEMVINEHEFGKGVEENGRDLIVRYHPRICLGGLRKTMKPLRIAGLRAVI